MNENYLDEKFNTNIFDEKFLMNIFDAIEAVNDEKITTTMRVFDVNGIIYII